LIKSRIKIRIRLEVWLNNNIRFIAQNIKLLSLMTDYDGSYPMKYFI